MGLSSSVFTADAVSAINPPASNQDNNKGQRGLTGSAIAGIVVGVILIFALAAALFIAYWRRRNAPYSDDSDDDAQESSGPFRPHPSGRNTGMVRVNGRSGAEQDVGKTAPHFTSPGDYCGHAQKEHQASRTIYASDFTTNTAGGNDAIPAHYAYIPGASSRTVGKASPGQVPSPPASIDRPEKSNKPDVFAIQAYLTAAEDSARLAAPSASVAAKPKTPVTHGFRIPLASLPKLGIPKKRMLRHKTAETPTPSGSHRGVEMQISEPVMGDDGRFGELAKENAKKPPTAKHKKSRRREDGYVEVPLRSGESALYGI